MLAAAIALERFEMVARRRAKVRERLRGIQQEKFRALACRSIAENRLNGLIVEQPLGISDRESSGSRLDQVFCRDAFRQTEWLDFVAICIPPARAGRIGRSVAVR